MTISSPDITEKKAPRSAQEMTHFYWLDGIRFLAAFMVMAFHARGGNWVEWARLDPEYQTRFVQAFFTITRVGSSGVVIFFVLSGFLVGGKVMERCLNKTFDPWSYAVDRFARIWVPLVPSLLFTAAVATVSGYPASFPMFLGNLFCLQGIVCDNYGHNAPLWTLSYEVWFYVLAGVAGTIVMGTAKGKVWLWIGLLLSLMVFTALAPVFLFCWLIGAFAYLLMSEKRSWIGLLFGLFVAVVGTALGQLDSNSVSMTFGALAPWLPSKDVSLLIQSMGIGLFFTQLCRLKPVSWGAIKFEQWGTSLAGFSYTLYLIHAPIMDVWEHFMPGRFPRVDAFSCFIYFCKIVSFLTVAWVLAFFFESRTHVVRKWLKKQWARS